MTREQLRMHARRRLTQSGVSLRAYARRIGCDPSHLSEFLRHGHRPAPKVVAALGFRLQHDRYARASRIRA